MTKYALGVLLLLAGLFMGLNAMSMKNQGFQTSHSPLGGMGGKGAGNPRVFVQR